MNLFEKVYHHFSDPDGHDALFYRRGKEKRSYHDARIRVASIADVLRSRGIREGSVVAIEAEKEFDVYCCFVACLLSGAAYVPFTKALNFKRIAPLLEQIGTELVLVSSEEARQFFQDHGFSVEVVPAIETSATALRWMDIPETNVAYIMFSSGTTGSPKAIPVTRRNLAAYIDSIESQFEISEGGGFSQIAELTFDLSIHDLYLCISNRGYICPIKSNEYIFAHRFVNEFNINYWMSVPSTVSYMFQLMPDVEAMPSLRYSFFLGEALSTDVVKRWLNVTPNGKTVNTYGPTECTVAASFYEVHPTDQVLETERLVPIGVPLKNAGLYCEAADGSELLLSGDQLFPGYAGPAAALDAEKFTVVDGVRRYRTGDLVEQRGDVFYFRGRIDFQVKVRGYRIELEELEATLTARLPGDFCIVPVAQIEVGNYEALAVVYSGVADDAAVKEIIKEDFPTYIPIGRLRKTETVPRNTNGKLDRKLASELLNSGP